ncbi:MAG: DUF4870 domain-containing protein [Actinomycetales bacterium]|nr:DUF4870 domain-containing protein [Actinomycetales bacterium]
MSDKNNPYAAPPRNPMRPEDERTAAVALHIAAIFFEFFAPLLGFLLLKDRGPFIAHHTRESLNFGITMLLLYVLLAVSVIGWFFFWLPPVLWTIVHILAAVRASEGKFYRLPLTIRFIK